MPYGPFVWSNKDSRKPWDAIYVGRPSIFGNPFVVGIHGERGECIELYRKWINQPEQEELRQLAKKILRGRDLACWCAPAPCHADVLLEVANAPEDHR